MVNLVINEIADIASKLSEVDDDNVELIIMLLLDLKPLLDSNFRAPAISEIWKHELPLKILSTLKRDSSYKWLSTCNLCAVVVDCCLGWIASDNHVDNEVILDVTYTILQILTKMTNYFIKTDKEMKEKVCGYISWVVKMISNLMESDITVTTTVVASKHFMQFLMMEDSSISLVALSLLKNILKANRNVFFHVSESRTHSIVDELAFKLFGNTDPNVAKVSISVLIALVDIHPPLLQIFTTKRYRGFKAYIIKWEGNGFDEKIKKIITILESQSKFLHTQKKDSAATVIQSFYRGYKVRQKLRKAFDGISKFQRIYRAKKLKSDKVRVKADVVKLKMLHLKSNRRKVFVNSKLKQLKTIEGIPAKTVNQFLENLEHDSARKIQAAWLGYRTRKVMEEVKPEMVKFRAAIVIQKHIRSWLEKCRMKRGRLADLLPLGLTDQRRIELQSVIVNVREKFPYRYKDEEEWKDLHEKSFRKLSNHFMLLRQMRREDERRKVLMAQLSVLSHQMANAPDLSDINENHIEQYSSRSTSISAAARSEHIDSLNELKMPWWKKFGVGSMEASIETANDRLYIRENEKLF